MTGKQQAASVNMHSPVEAPLSRGCSQGARGADQLLGASTGLRAVHTGPQAQSLDGPDVRWNQRWEDCPGSKPPLLSLP